jgi:hypothetical protein
MQQLAFSIEDLYNDVKERAFSEGAFSREEWEDITEEVLAERLGVQEMHDDEDTGEIKEALLARFTDFTEELRSM